MELLTVAVFGLIFLILIKVYAVLTLGKCHSKRKLHGMTAMVTGASRGIGYMTALNLAKRGARVIITSRYLDNLQKIRKQMIQESGNTDIVAKQLDLLSLKGVRAFAKDILATEQRLDILVNNAGTSGLGDKLTKDGLLPGLQANYFGPFLLTNLLLGLLKQSGNSRIVNVSSVLSNIRLGFDRNNINKIKMTHPLTYELFVYSNSKICISHATIEMAKRLKGSGVTVNCLHPGLVHTKIFVESKTSVGILGGKLLGPTYLKTPKEGAETSIHLAACESVEGVTGKYFSDCRPSWIGIDLSASARAQVWEQSVKLVGLKPEEMFL